MTRAFVIRPFGEKEDSGGKKIDFNRIQAELIDPALIAADPKMGGGTTGEIVDAGNIRSDMFALILEADLVVCDITILNANVFYELGIRHALRKKRTVLIKGFPSSDDTPFDILTDRYLPYDVDQPANAKAALQEMIVATLASDRETDSPIFQLLPSLPEADPARVQVVPLDFREEVNRAGAAKAKGWLRLLSEEVRRLRFQWEGVKLVAQAQWDAKDYTGARESWEAVIATHPDDIAANLALANIYERIYRESKRPELIQASDDAIERVLANAATSRTKRAEALALKGRNQKTRWRLEFDAVETPEARRKAAMNRALIQLYEVYRDAFSEDLNHFYSGLNTFQISTILMDLRQDEAWYEAFDDDETADRFRTKLEKEHAAWRHLVPKSIETGLAQLDTSDPERIWAEISHADELFLTSQKREGRVIGAYRDAIPLDKPFAWDAARGQLQLFADLGVQTELADKVIREIDARFPRKPSAEHKPVHLLVFAGHQVDAPGRPAPRFPQAKVGLATARIREKVQALLADDQHEFVGLASAAAGADILAHEICAELGLDTKICLPMPSSDFASNSFENLDDWRNRFLQLQREHDVLTLSDRNGLPRWLQSSGKNPWERGNEWVIKMALTWGAERVTLIALWDGKAEGDAPGGTAQLVRLAEGAGTVGIERIDAAELLA